MPQVKLIADQNRRHLGFLTSSELTGAAKRGTLLIATVDTEIIGFLNFWFRRDSIATIYTICVALDHQRTGVGRVLLGELARLARGAGMNTLRLKCPVDEGANSFYARMGFQCLQVIQGRRRRLNVWERLLQVPSKTSAPDDRL